MRKIKISLVTIVLPLVFVSTLPAGVTVNNINILNPTAFSMSVPIDGYSPQVVFGVTNDISSMMGWDALRQTTLSGTPYPSSSSPYYTVGILDTGATVNLLSRQDRNGFGLGSTGNLIDLSGAGPNPVYGEILNNAGFFGDGLQALAGRTTPTTANFKGVSNVAPVAAQQYNPADPTAGDIPTVLGLPFAVNYTTVITADQNYTGTFNGKTYTTPKVEFKTSNTSLPPIDYQLHITYDDSGGMTTLPPIYIPPGYEDFGMDPTPTVASSMRVQAAVTNQKPSDLSRHFSGNFLFDTGAQVTVISESAAINSLQLDLSHPEFTVEITGVNGTLENAPGFILDSLTLPAYAGVGDLTLTDVPVIVQDLSSGAGGTLMGIVGMNLFADRTLVINSGYTSNSSWDFDNAFIGISAAGKHPGDANGDGAVNVSDLGILAANYGAAGYAAWSMGDFNRDGMIDVSDLGILAANYGSMSGAGVAVPEPATLALLLLGGLAFVRIRKI